jgi:hypothetical protein
MFTVKLDDPADDMMHLLDLGWTVVSAVGTGVAVGSAAIGHIVYIIKESSA